MPPDAVNLLARQSGPASLSERTLGKAHEVLSGRKYAWRNVLAFAGPAVVVSVAYIDPGNFATNIEAGARHGYALLWVALLASLMAMLFQALSAKLGIVTGYNLAELCRMHFSRGTVLGLWAVSEISAMATDLAEFVGAAIALALLMHLPLLVGMAATAVMVFAILPLQRRGFRPFELIIAAFVAIVSLAYLAELLIVPADWGQAAFHAVIPQIDGHDALILAAGMVGATVMPHTLYLHSGLTQRRVLPRTDAERRRLVSFSNREAVVALAFAGLVNLAMVITAAAAFHPNEASIADLESAYRTLGPLLGYGAAVIFLISLLAAGISSSVVGTLAGQMIMQGFLKRPIPLWLRRLITTLPAFSVVLAGVDATRALVLSQVVLSLALPFPMFALLRLSCRQDVMGDFASRPVIRRTAMAAAVLVSGLNAVVVVSWLFGPPA